MRESEEMTQILFIGDPDQLPAVGAGNVLFDLIVNDLVPKFKLTKVFRQASKSHIIKYAHAINTGKTPEVISPVYRPNAFNSGVDCLFLDSAEATKDQLKFISKAQYIFKNIKENDEEYLVKAKDKWTGKLVNNENEISLEKVYQPEIENLNEIKTNTFLIPDKYQHIDLSKLSKSQSEVESLLSVLKGVHPWSSLKFGMTALDTATRLYLKTIREWLGENVEIQILSPQIRGSMGTRNLNMKIQKESNPPSPSKNEILIGEKIFRTGDRVIQTRNNYNLGVFNGDIGKIESIDSSEMSISVVFSGPTSRYVTFEKEDLSELQLAYAITIHKSQGSEFEAVIIPVLGQHFNMLFRNLIYTGLTRAKKLAIFVGDRRAFKMAIQQIDNRKRQTALSTLIK